MLVHFSFNSIEPVSQVEIKWSPACCAILYKVTEEVIIKLVKSLPTNIMAFSFCTCMYVVVLHVMTLLHVISQPI